MAGRFNYPDDDYEDALTIVKGISENGIGIGAFSLVHWTVKPDNALVIHLCTLAVTHSYLVSAN
jgi:hypothetical protein